MKKDYTELISGLESVIQALVNIRKGTVEYLNDFENAALALENVIDSNFMEEVESGKEPDIQGLHDYLREMFCRLAEHDPENFSFCCLLKYELESTFDPLIQTFTEYLTDLKNNVCKTDDIILDNPFYEVTEIIDNTKE